MNKAMDQAILVAIVLNIFIWMNQEYFIPEMWDQIMTHGIIFPFVWFFAALLLEWIKRKLGWTTD